MKRRPSCYALFCNVEKEGEEDSDSRTYAKFNPSESFSCLVIVANIGYKHSYLTSLFGGTLQFDECELKVFRENICPETGESV